MKDHGIKEVSFRGVTSHSHLGRHWVSAQECCSEAPAKCYTGMWSGWSPVELYETGNVNEAITENLAWWKPMDPVVQITVESSSKR